MKTQCDLLFIQLVKENVFAIPESYLILKKNIRLRETVK